MKNQHETPEALAHALFTAAQLAPGEGIEDAVGRLAALVEAHQHASIAELEAELEAEAAPQQVAIDQLLRLHDENKEMKELLREHGIKYPKQQPVLFTKMVDFEPR